MTDNELNIILNFQDKLTGISAQLKQFEETTSPKLQSIEAQTLKTNGRVTELEKRHLTCPIDTVNKDNEYIKKSLDVILFISKHPLLGGFMLIGSGVFLIVDIIMRIFFK